MKDILSKSTSKYIIFGLVIFFAVSIGIVVGFKFSEGKNNTEDKIIIDITQNNNSNSKTESNIRKININTCSIEELKTLQGIGDSKSEKIIKNRPYKNISDLLKIITQDLFENIKEKVEI